jgi:hypothetical protein
LGDDTHAFNLSDSGAVRGRLLVVVVTCIGLPDLLVTTRCDIDMVGEWLPHPFNTIPASSGSAAKCFTQDSVVLRVLKHSALFQ